MSETELKDVIAERQLVGKKGEQTFTVTVKIGRPVPHPKGDWECPYLISGLPNPISIRVAGVDAVQALYRLQGCSLKSSTTIAPREAIFCTSSSSCPTMFT